MKLIYIAFLDARNDTQQFLRKVSHQCDALRRANSDFRGYVIGSRNEECSVLGYSCAYIDLNKFVFIDALHAKDVRVRVAAAIIEQIKPDLVYMRYPWADRSVLWLVTRFKNIVFEHQTKELPELQFIQSDLYKAEKEYGRRVMQKVRASVCVTPEILTYEKRRAGKGHIGCVNPNGIDVKSIPVKKEMRKTDRIEIICVADFTKWHGYDRLLRGLAQYKGLPPVHVHMVGNGPETEAYKRIVHAKKLGSKVTFWGRCDGKELNRLIDRSDVAVSSLGLFRMGWRDASPLKSREYCVRGIPFCYAGNDDDFHERLFFVKKIASEEKAVHVKELVHFAVEMRGRKNVAREMQEYAHENLSWDVKMGKVGDYLKSIYATNRDADRPKRRLRNISFDENRFLSKFAARARAKKSKSLQDKLLLGVFYQSKGRNQEAYKYFQKVFVANHSSYTYLFDVLERMKELVGSNLCEINAYYDKAIRLLLAQKSKGLYDTYYLASMYKKSGNFDESVRWFEQALAMKNSGMLHAGILFHLGELFLIKKETKKATKHFNECLRLCPDHAKARKYLNK